MSREQEAGEKARLAAGQMAQKTQALLCDVASYGEGAGFSVVEVGDAGVVGEAFEAADAAVVEGGC